MGMLTTAYEVPEKMMRIIIKDPPKLDVITYPEKFKGKMSQFGVDENWEPKTLSFDKEDNLFFNVINKHRLGKTLKSLETKVENNSFYARFYFQSSIKLACLRLTTTDTGFPHTKEDVLGDPSTYDNPDDYEYCSHTFDLFQELLCSAAESNSYILLISA